MLGGKLKTAWYQSPNHKVRYYLIIFTRSNQVLNILEPFPLSLEFFHLYELCMPVFGKTLRAILFEVLNKTHGQLDVRRYLLIVVELNCNFFRIGT